MKIQSLSIVVPTNRCVNDCKFCVSKMHENNYHNLDKSYVKQKIAIEKRLKYAVLHEIDTLILTGTGEPLQNIGFLEMLSDILYKMNNPIPRIEIQTSGVMLSDKNLQFLYDLGVTTISLSISDIFNNENNLDIIGVPEVLKFNLEDIINNIHKYDMNVRLSLNMISSVYTNFNNDKIEGKNRLIIEGEISKILDKTNELGASQITFRKMYSSGGNTKEDKWVKENELHDNYFLILNDYIKGKGRKLYRLPFGGIVYSINGISTVVDDDCMNTEYNDDNLKYLILREDMKLYTHWDDKGSLIF